MLRVFDEGDAVSLMHGTTTHGWQSTDPERRNQPISYYGPHSGIGRVMERTGENRHVGVIGLGAGTMAAWTNEGDRIRFYEIDPDVEQIARVWFWYLAECRGEVDIVIGDARLQLERESPQRFDVLAVDAFSSDSIPVHLLTLEAFELYLSHLKDDGVLAVHITNRYLDLLPVISQAAAHLDLHWTWVEDAGAGDDLMSTDWVLLARDAQTLNGLGGKRNPIVQEIRAWTDDYSNLFRVLR